MSLRRKLAAHHAQHPNLHPDHAAYHEALVDVLAGEAPVTRAQRAWQDYQASHPGLHPDHRAYHEALVDVLAGEAPVTRAQKAWQAYQGSHPNLHPRHAEFHEAVIDAIDPRPPEARDEAPVEPGPSRAPAPVAAPQATASVEQAPVGSGKAEKVP